MMNVSLFCEFDALFMIILFLWIIVFIIDLLLLCFHCFYYGIITGWLLVMGFIVSFCEIIMIVNLLTLTSFLLSITSNRQLFITFIISSFIILTVSSYFNFQAPIIIKAIFPFASANGSCSSTILTTSTLFLSISLSTPTTYSFIPSL